MGITCGIGSLLVGAREAGFRVAGNVEWRKYAGVYQIANSMTGRVYLGGALDLHKRFQHHKRMLERGKHANPQLQIAWNKHGSSSFTFRVLLVCRPEDVLVYEQQVLNFWIDHWDQTYNICRDVSAPMAGIKFSPLHRVRLAQSIRAAYQDPVLRGLVSSRVSTAYQEDPTLRDRVSRGNILAHADPEIKKHHALGVKTSHARPETKEKLSRINKGRVFSPEVRAKMSAAAKRRWGTS